MIDLTPDTRVISVFVAEFNATATDFHSDLEEAVNESDVQYELIDVYIEGSFKTSIQLEEKKIGFFFENNVKRSVIKEINNVVRKFSNRNNLKYDYSLEKAKALTY